MNHKAVRKYSIIASLSLFVMAMALMGFTQIGKPALDNASLSMALKGESQYSLINPVEPSPMPMYGHWKNFSSKDGLPANKTYCVKIDGNRVLAGTHEGLAVYENGQWKTYTTEDGLAHNGVLAIDVSEQTGDVWLGTMGGLTRWSAGKFENFTQLNSGMPNNLIYGVTTDGNDVWVATGGGAGHYDTYTKRWEIFTEQNAPMHEPWTYGISSGDGKIFIAAWGGGVVEYTKKTKKFRDYTDPDGNMEIDLFPDDGVVHDITTGTSYADGKLWVATYFGLSRYDGLHWKGYFDHDSGLASNFINFIKATGPVVFICTDKGLSSTDGENWITYTKNETNGDGKMLMTSKEGSSELTVSPSISHNYILGVDVKDGVIWVATSDGLSRGELLKN
jgi:ligand-binding sensor domain-containing protein